MKACCYQGFSCAATFFIPPSAESPSPPPIGVIARGIRAVSGFEPIFRRPAQGARGTSPGYAPRCAVRRPARFFCVRGGRSSVFGRGFGCSVSPSVSGLPFVAVCCPAGSRLVGCPVARVSCVSASGVVFSGGAGPCSWCGRRVRPVWWAVGRSWSCPSCGAGLFGLARFFGFLPRPSPFAAPSLFAPVGPVRVFGRGGRPLRWVPVSLSVPGVGFAALPLASLVGVGLSRLFVVGLPARSAPGAAPAAGAPLVLALGLPPLPAGRWVRPSGSRRGAAAFFVPAGSRCPSRPASVPLSGGPGSGGWAS